MIITGGFGQSGVSTLNVALTAHPDIATCPLETCFVFARAAYHAAIDAYFSDVGAVKYRGDGLTIEPRIRIGARAFPDKAKRLHFPWWLGRERDFLYTMPRRPRP